MKPLLLVFLFVPLISCSQSAQFREIKVKPSPEKYNVDTPTIIYPIIVLTNNAVAKKINSHIKRNIADFYADDSTLSVNSTLRAAANEGLTDLTYEVTFNKNGILSLIFWVEGVGAYPSSSKETLNFDLVTGKSLTLKEIFLPEKFNAFKKTVHQDKINYLEEFKKELKEDVSNNETDSSDYDPAVELANECSKSVSLDQFIFTSSGISVFDDCDFPHMIQAMEPVYDLSYKFSMLKSSIKPKRFTQLTQ